MIAVIAVLSDSLRIIRIMSGCAIPTYTMVSIEAQGCKKCAGGRKILPSVTKNPKQYSHP